MRIYFALSLCLVAAPLTSQAQPTIEARPAKENVHIDTQAIALLDKTARYYGSLRSLKLVTRGSSTWKGETSSLRLTLFFERPNRVRAQGEADGMKSVFVADGKTVFIWDDWVNDAVKRPQHDRYTQPWRDLMGNADYFVAPYLADWLFGEHWLRPLQINRIEKDVDVFEAKFLPSKLVNGASAEGVQLRAIRNASGKEAKFVTQQTMWFRADGRLVRAEQTNDFGDQIKRKAVDVVGARANDSLPAATWALKK